MSSEQKQMSSEQKQKSKSSLFTAIAYVASVSIGAAAALAVIQTNKEKNRLNEKLRQNSTECNERFVDPEQLVANEGDLVEIQRDIYAHWVIYVGEGHVIHLVDYPNGKAQVLRQCLKDIAKDCVCRVNNLITAAQRRNLIPRNVSDILKAAYEKLNDIFDYHLIDNNCEHFATYCRYGSRFSEQALAAKDKPIIRTIGPVLARSSPIVAASIAKLANNTTKQ